MMLSAQVLADIVAARGLKFALNAPSSGRATIIGIGSASGAAINIPATVSSDATTDYDVTSIGELAFFNYAVTSLTVLDSVTRIGDGAFFNNDITSVAFLGNFGAFSLDIVTSNLDLASVTYCQGAAGWPQTFMRAEKDSLTAEEVDCAAPVPAVTPLATVGWPGRAAVGADMVGLPCSFCRR